MDIFFILGAVFIAKSKEVGRPQTTLIRSTLFVVCDLDAPNLINNFYTAY